MPVLKVHSITVRENEKNVIDNLSFTIQHGEQWAIVGPSGSGKTTLLNTLAGRHSHSGEVSIGESNDESSQKLVLVEQQHRFKNLSNTNTFYYQQRFNSSDSEDAITVNEDLQHYIDHSHDDDLLYSQEVDKIIDLLRLRNLLPVKLIQLSNGENKRLQIAKVLLLKPTILLLDNPFTGLDAAARRTLNDLLQTISTEGIQIILVTAQHQIPAFITHVLSLERNGNYESADKDTYLQKNAQNVHTIFFIPDPELLKSLSLTSANHEFGYAVRMKHVNVQYNNRKILDNISWEVCNGDRWSLSGPNGSGKSTLLSLINADNPQAYANEIYLFDKRKGTGESIWDIKKRIGFVSPELHLYFDTSMNAFDVVASGLFDTIGLFRMLNEVQEKLVSNCIKLLRIEHLARKFLFQLSNSEQRLVLLARALVKDPPMLLLDEPCQGLDEDQVELFRSMVNEICVKTNKTLIYVSHYPHEIPACVNKFFRLEEGRRIE